MREKNKSHKKRVILVCSIVVIAISLCIVNLLCNNSSKLENNIDKKDKVINNVKVSKDENELEEKVEDMGEESTTEEIKTEVSNTPKTNNNSNSNQKASNNNTQSTTTKNNNENTKTISQSQTSTPSTRSDNEVKQTQPSVDLTKVASTNDINYGIHKGIVEFSTNAGCEKAGNDIVDLELNQVIAYNAENNNSKSVDIRYPACYQVTSQANTIMGYYLNIYCESDNCNRYKSLINISNYD